MTKEEVAKILQKARIEAGMTQKEAAEAIGRKRQTLASWETGKSQPDANTLFVLFEAYGADINEAFGFTTKDWYYSKHEKALIKAYRDNPDMQAAVDKLLDLAFSEHKECETEDTVRVFRAAKSRNNEESQIIDVPRSLIEKLKAAKEADEI